MKPLAQSDVIVIGAGLSGLAAARELTLRNVPVTILDAGERVADPWRNRHPLLRLNIHRHFAALPGAPMTRRNGTFVRRDSVVDYLQCYASDLDVPIIFGASVSGIQKAETGWRVATASQDYLCKHLIVATGRDRVPHIPDWQGMEGFTGEILHAADLGDITRFNNKRVLVVGAGNSGSDVLNHLARHAPAKVWISVRHGPAIVPNRVFGFPLHRLARVFAALPALLLDPAFRITQRLLLGNLTRYGLKSHPDGGGTRLLRDGIAFAIDDGFAAAIRKRRFQVVREVTGFNRDRVLLSDGSACTPDTVICATGYRTGLESLFGAHGVLDANGQPIHPMGEANPLNPGLWFTGFKPLFTGYFDAAGIAANRIAEGIAAATTSLSASSAGAGPPLGLVATVSASDKQFCSQVPPAS